MGMFDYKNYSSATIAEMITSHYKLATYTNAATFMGFPGAKILNWLGNLGELTANKYDINPPKNWRELTPQELNLPASVKDYKGYYNFDSPVYGKSPIPGTGQQAKIFGKFDESGRLTQISFAFAGTNDVFDFADYFKINSGEIVFPAESLLTAVKNYALSHNLTAQDIVITGYSLGAALTNLAAKYSDSLAGGFYKQANFLAFASPYIYDKAEMILNLGYENDAVYRYLGSESTLNESLQATKPGFVNNDKEFNSTSDNMILFGKEYGSFLWSNKLLGIWNLKFGWAAHQAAIGSDAYQRILNSKFYEYTDIDSTVIVDQLAATSRWCTWVKDKLPSSDKDYGRSAFMFGNEYNNLLAAGKGNDYVDAGGGNDKISTGQGLDRIDGGTGIDTLVLQGRKDDWNAFRLSDGTLFMQAKDRSGLTQAENVEKVEFHSEILTWTRPYDIKEGYLQDNRFLIKWWNKNKYYDQHVEGTNNDDVLTGNAVFAKAGNDKLTAVKNGSLLHGGEGNDILLGNDGNDELYGAEGHDILQSSRGSDLLYGGVGNDIFLFKNTGQGRTVVKDFNSFSGDKDNLLFSKHLFASTDEVLTAMQQHGRDVHLYKSGMTMIIENSYLDEFSNKNVGII